MAVLGRDEKRCVYKISTRALKTYQHFSLSLGDHDTKVIFCQDEWHGLFQIFNGPFVASLRILWLLTWEPAQFYVLPFLIWILKHAFVFIRFHMNNNSYSKTCCLCVWFQWNWSKNNLWWRRILNRQWTMILFKISINLFVTKFIGILSFSAEFLQLLLLMEAERPSYMFYEVEQDIWMVRIQTSLLQLCY